MLPKCEMILASILWTCWWWVSISSEGVDDMPDVVAACPEPLPALARFDEERGDRLLNYISIAVPDTDRFLLVTWAFNFRQRLLPVRSSSAYEVVRYLI